MSPYFAYFLKYCVIFKSINKGPRGSTFQKSWKCQVLVPHIIKLRFIRPKLIRIIPRSFWTYYWNIFSIKMTQQVTESAYIFPHFPILQIPPKFQDCKILHSPNPRCVGSTFPKEINITILKFPRTICFSLDFLIFLDHYLLFVCYL